MEGKILTVTELNKHLTNLFDGDMLLHNIGIRGEISNFKLQSSGHMYFTLKDKESQLNGVMFKYNTYHLKFKPANGMKVIAFGDIGVYAPYGKYQITAKTMEPEGLGNLYLAYLQLKEKLEKEGLFSSSLKKRLPKLPKRIGVITSPTGAAVRDIINVLTRRMPMVEILVIPAAVQGVEAIPSLVQALKLAEDEELDLIIIGRGGGSLEDLWAFNEEKVVRAAFDCPIPLISAVGHETDTTLIDFVADMRAPTPSAAAEIAVPDINELLADVAAMKEKLRQSLRYRLEDSKNRLSLLKQHPVWSSPSFLIDRYHQKLEKVLARQPIWQQPEMLLADHWRRLDEESQKLELSNPLQFLKKGYLLAQKEGQVITSTNDIAKGDQLQLHLTDGIMSCRVEDVQSKN